MKNYTKKLIALFLAILCVLSISTNVYAKETALKEEKTKKEKTKEDKEVKDCRLTFCLADKTNGAFIDDITITLLNNETDVAYTYTMTSADYLFGITVGGNVKQGSYSIALNYASKEQFTIQNTDGTPISSFTADGTECTFNWEVISNVSAEVPQDNTQDNAQGNTVDDNSTADSYVTDTGDEEANALWNTFLEKVSVIETDSQYSSILEIVKNMSETCAKNYAEATGRDKEEYLKMTPYEQFLWDSTYIRPVEAITSSSYDTYCSTVEKWNTYSVSFYYNALSNFGTQEMADAYRALMEWDYYYFKEHGAVMNFMTGRTSLEENKDLDVLSSEDSNGNNSDPTQEEIDKLMDEEKGETDKGIWNNTMNLIKENAITIAILLILVGATIGVVIYRKRKTIDDVN